MQLSRTPRKSEPRAPDAPEPNIEVSAPPAAVSRLDVRPFIWSVFLVILVLSIVVHFDRLAQVTFTNSDDMGFDVMATAIKNEGSAQYWQHVGHLAKEQGRVYFYVSGVLFILPFLTDSEAVRAAMTTAVHVASCAAVAVLLSFYLPRIACVVFLLLVYVFLPHWNGFYPIGAYPVAYHCAVLLFAAGVSAMITLRRHESHGGRRVALRAGAIGCLFLSYFFYEALWFSFLSISVLVAYVERESGRQGGLAALARTTALPVTVFAVQAVLYVVFKRMFPSTYAGNQMAPFEVAAIWRVVSTILSHSYPSANFFRLIDFIGSYSPGAVRVPELAHVIQTVSATVAVQAAGACGALALLPALLRRARPEPNRQQIRTATAIATIAAACAILTVLPVGLSAKYQQHLDPPQISGYFAFLFLTVTLTCVLTLGAIVAARQGRVARFFYAAVTIVGGGPLIVATASANDAVIASQREFSAPWRMLKALTRTPVFAEMPDGAVVLAPSMWRSLDARHQKDYWTSYVYRHTGRQIAFQHSLDPAVMARHAPALYFGDIQLLPTTSEAALLLSRINLEKIPEVTVSNAVVLISDRNLQRAAIAAFAGDALSDEPPHTREVDLPIGVMNYTNGAFWVRLHRPNLIAGTPHIALRNTNPWAMSTLPLDFGAGFSSLETGGGAYWRWNDGQNATGELIIDNITSDPLHVRFEAIVRTATVEPTRMDISLVGAPTLARYFRNGDKMSEVLMLQPGRNRIVIRSYGQRIPAPADPRYMVFGIQNWRVIQEQTPGTVKRTSTR